MIDPMTAAIADVLCVYFTGGIRLGEDVLSFAHSTLGAATFTELEPLLIDPAEYGEGLLELVFSPPHTVSLKIEPLVPDDGIQAATQLDIAKRVAGRIPSVRLYIEYPGTFADRALTPSIIAGFVKKMKLGKQIRCLHLPVDPGSPSRHTLLSARMLIRSIDFRVTPGRESFITSLMNRLVIEHGLGERLALRCLELVVRLFRDMEDDIDIPVLLSHKIQLNRAVMERKRFFNEYQRTHTMEFLMCQKIYDPPESIGTMMEEIALAEIVNAAVFGRSGGTCVGEGPSLGSLIREWEQLALREA
jgi:hypothetical protein